MLKAGAFLQGRYEIIYRIGSGGMADVYKAKDHKLNRFVAVKVLKKEFRDDIAFLSKFRVEAQAAAGMSHPNVVNVYDVGEDRGISYIVMELVEGITLKAYINKKGKLSVREAVSITMQIASGLEAAHNNGIIHRDIKPQNILISMDGKAKVADFGIARAANANTISSSAMGSVHYSSPEQTRGGYSDAKSDIYSLGVTLFEMVTGRVPFDGESTVEVALKHLQEEMPSPRQFTPEIPVSLEQIIVKCTQKSPDRRYGKMGELIADLKESLVNPNGNFVTLKAVDRKAQTVMLSQEEMDQIKKSYMPSYDDYEPSYEEDDRTQERENTSDAAEEKRQQTKVPRKQSRTKKNSRASEKARKRRLEQEKELGRERIITLISIVTALAVIAVIGWIAVRASSKLIGSSGGDQGNQKETTVQVQTPAATTGTEAVQKQELTVPDVSRYSKEEAVSVLTKMGLKVSIDQTRYSNSVASGYVITSNPGSGSPISAGETVTIFVSQGTDSAQIEVRDVVGKYENEASQALTNSGLYVYVKTQSSETVESGMVIAQDISGGTMVAPGTAVTLTVSTGTAEEAAVVPEDDDTVWRCNAQLNAPEGYNDEPVRITIRQGTSEEVTVFEGKTSFPYILNVEGQTGISSGVAYVYTLDAETWKVKQTTEYAGVVFTPDSE